MGTRLGKRQLEQLASLAGVYSAIVVPDALTRSMCKRGVMVPGSATSDGFLVMTPAGYRAVADALESGAIVRLPVEQWNKAK